MAVRPVFSISVKSPYYIEIPTDFRYYSGFSESQKRKSIISLHSSFLDQYPSKKILEVSTKSENPFGIKMSAFNLKYKLSSGEKCSVESAFQSSKVFKDGGPYTDLLFEHPAVAKKDPRVRTGAEIIGFSFQGEDFSNQPMTFFYDWLYINALSQNPDIVNYMVEYDAFTDIEFNPQKSVNCQARSAAVFTSLYKTGLIEIALKSRESFKTIVYNHNSTERQLRLW